MDASRKIAGQLLKEFSVPLTAACVWLALNWTGSSTLERFKHFMEALFFVSWFSGQLFRVIKQHSTESRLGGIADRLQALDGSLVTSTAGLERALNKMHDFQTGGHSFVKYVVAQPMGSEVLQFSCFHEGDYPVQNIHTTVIDVGLMQQSFNAHRPPGAGFPDPRVHLPDIPMLPIKQAITNIATLPISGRTRFQFTLQVTALNGTYHQIILLEKLENADGWRSASVILGKFFDEPETTSRELYRQDPLDLLDASGNPKSPLGQ